MEYVIGFLIGAGVMAGFASRFMLSNEDEQ